MKNSEIITKFMLFGYNYPNNFIAKVWEDNPNMANHLQGKFSSCYDRFGTMAYFRWYMELDNENREKLTNWIELNYKG